MKITDFDYELSEELIAIEPPAVRGTSRLLVLDKSSGEVEDRKYSNVVEYVNPGDVVVLNDTKVIPARLKVKKANGAERELILLEKHGADEDWHRHKVLYRRRLGVGDELVASDGSNLKVEEILGDGIAVVSSREDLLELSLKIGEVPLPPYMHRQATKTDKERYQTVWANEPGSVAAPTASLNMTEETIKNLEQKGATICYVTLHVGLGTFLPIREGEVENHVMHKEYFEIPASTVEILKTAKKSQNKIIAVGTTVTRTLEYAADQILASQSPLHGEADIFIYPGYEFKMVDSLLTNFHAPRSTVLMLAAAFAGWANLKSSYQHAIEKEYNFLSYGDSMFIYGEKP